MREISETQSCPRDDIAAYVDGELSSDAAADLERHIEACAICSRSLVQHRQFLAALSTSLEAGDQIDLPDDFTKKVVTNAESRVTGLRRPHEMFTAVFICAALFLFAIFALGGEAFSAASVVGSIGEKFWTVGTFLLKFIANVAFAVTVIVRSLTSHFGAAGISTLVILFFATAVLLFSSRRVFKRRSA